MMPSGKEAFANNKHKKPASLFEMARGDVLRPNILKYFSDLETRFADYCGKGCDLPKSAPLVFSFF